MVLNCDVLFHPRCSTICWRRTHDAALLVAYREAGPAAVWRRRDEGPGHGRPRRRHVQDDGSGRGGRRKRRHREVRAARARRTLDGDPGPARRATAACASGRRRPSASSRNSARCTPSRPPAALDRNRLSRGLPARGVRGASGDRGADGPGAGARNASAAARREPAGCLADAESTLAAVPPTTEHQSGWGAAGRRHRRRHRAAQRAARTAAADLSGRASREATRDRLVAVVATSDDGGSSGRLRAQFNIIPPGDIRNCLAALSDNHVADCRDLPVSLRRAGTA